MAYIEFGTFKLKTGVSENVLLDTERNIRNGRIRQQPGYVGRELARGDNGEWLIIIRWESKEHGEAWTPVFMQDPQAHALMGAMEMSTIRQEHFTLETL